MYKKSNACVHLLVIFLTILFPIWVALGIKKFHISTYIKQFFNSEVRTGTQITNVDETVNALVNFYDEKMQKELAKIKTVANRTKKCALVYKSENYLLDNVYKFKAMIALYKDSRLLSKWL